jgi:hypothetical protein
MSTVAAVTFIVLLVVQALGTLVYLFLIARMFSYLESHHADVYEALGNPSLFLNNSIQNNRLVLGWLWREEYSDIADVECVHRARTVRKLLIALSVNFAVLLVVFVAFGASIRAV